MKVLLTVLDGISDRPIKKFDEKTPLKKSDTPNLDHLARSGVNGILDPISPGIRAGSDTAHLSLLGYEPRDIYTGRGPLEASGAGIKVKKGDLGLRCNFATKENNEVVDRRAGRISNTSELVKSINEEISEIEGVKVFFKESTGHRAGLVLRGKNLSNKITDSDPKKPHKEPKKIKPLEKEAKKTATILNQFISETEKILKDHPLNEKREKRGDLPANTVLLRGAGKVPEIDNIKTKYGIKGGLITATGLIKGIGKICGLDIIEVPDASGSVDSDIVAKAEKTLEVIDDYDFILLHIKGGDEASHDGDPEKKVKFLEEKIDPAMKKIVNNLDNENVVKAVTADHTTSSELKDHTGDPVPLTINSSNVRKDEVTKFSEETYKGGINRIKGRNLMPILLDLANRTEKYGA
ncbi:MAG: 23-bisphosphoglycerate-independent phosphoglycerate mutase ApgM [Candidatus Methanohalarchaeum thermophilum]|uniref:2,3-bisphosphoglycerate-independent phosphoglycerate mutase n=1 Tax=Methanohalarchaeum thermophilum TaxID=1903181 RepID=A0A1Q6DV74_METT1|nr:MAG: 23-bisphosphoglycerate-independent phosphoglycerate mutase ApgM [Candidatus Methanohalarchaeum thermophilum]